VVDPFARFHQLLKAEDLTAAEQALHQVNCAAGTTQSAQANFSKYYLSRFKQWQNESASAPPQTISDADSEFDWSSELADCKVFSDFLNQLQNQQVIRQLYPLRWQAIGSQDWHSVVEDVSAIKSRLSEFGGSYHFLLAESMKYTVWHSDDRCLAHNNACWEEISCQDGWLADSTEVLILAAEQWKEAPTDFPYVQEIPMANCSLPNTALQTWLPIAESLAQNPKASLYDLDGYYRTHPIMMSVFAQGLTTLAAQTRTSIGQQSWESLTKIVARFFDWQSRHRVIRDYHEFSNYRSARVPILNFCIDNHINPFTLGQQASQFVKNSKAPTWHRIIQNDGPLQCVYNACRSIGY